MPCICVEGAPGSGKEAVVKAASINLAIPACIYKPSMSDLTDAQMDPGRWSFFVQLKILLERTKRLQDMRGLKNVVVTGSPLSDRLCHADNACMTAEELRLYHDWAAHLSEKLDVDTQHVILNVEPETNFHRVVHKARREQAHWTRQHCEAAVDRFRATFHGYPEIIITHGMLDNEVMLQAACTSLSRHVAT